MGGSLKPKVFCISELAQQGAGHPDLGLYGARQVQRGNRREGQAPEGGVVEVKPAGDDAWLTAESSQVSQYWDRYRLVLVTNTRDFVLLGEDGTGQPVKLETFRLADTAQAFESRLETPRAFARDTAPGLVEYLCRALSHRASLSEPKDLAWLLASYARDGLARVEAAGDAPSLRNVRSALEEALGVHFEGERGPPSSVLLWCRLSSTASFPPGCSGLGRPRRRPVGSTGTKQSGTCAPRSCGRCSNSLPTPADYGPWAWWRCWTGPRRRWTGWTGTSSSPGSTKARLCHISTNLSWKPSTLPCANSCRP